MHSYNFDPSLSVFASHHNASVTDSLKWEPKKIVKEWTNGDGVKNITLVIALTGGAAEKNSSGVECKVTTDGTVFAISEHWSALMLEMKTFYNKMALDNGETEDEFERRRFAMEDATTVMKKHAKVGEPLKSVFKMTLPFPVDPTSLRVRIMGTTDGNRFCHIDLTEKQKYKVTPVVMMDAGRYRCKPGSTEKPTRYSGLY